MRLSFSHIILALCIPVTGLCQNTEFKMEWLNAPGKYAKEIESRFTTDYTTVFTPVTSPDYVILENGYAKSLIKNKDSWNGVTSGYYVDTITFIYTQYPKDISFWLTNYHSLLANRLKELFKLDPSLNNDSIVYKILLQTECNTDMEARKMFHGIAIHESPIEETKSDTGKSAENILKPDTMYSPVIKTPDAPNLAAVRKINSFIAGNGGITDSVVYKVFARHPEWTKSLVIMDWTGSMYPYGAQAVLWHSLNLKKSGIRYFVFFNDGNMERRKKIGRTRGIYFEKAENINKVISLLSKVKAKGNGGDPEENDLEAIIKGIQKYPDFKEVILIADNNSCMRDYCLFKEIKVPLKIILCGTYTGINPQYINLAYKTGGSIHTIEDDISDFYNKTKSDAIFMIDELEYRFDKKRDLFEYVSKTEKTDPHYCESFYKKKNCKCETIQN